MKDFRKYFHSADGLLCFGKIAIDTIVEKYGTPLFIYDSSVLDKKWNLLRNTLPSNFKIFYSVKANPNRALIKYFLAKGSGLEIASGGEFHQALQAGCHPQNMLIAGPGKTEAELELVISKGIGEIHAESILELQRINAIGRKLNLKTKVAIRVNPGSEAQGGAMRMGGKPAPFGIDEECLDGALKLVSSSSFIEFQGIHLFSGTQILDASVLINQYRKGLEIAKQVANNLQRPLQTIDFGGGLGIPYFPHEQELDMDQLKQELNNLMSEIKGDKFFSGTQFIIEPGRYLVGESGIYVVRVNDIKISRGKKFIILDGGMNHHLAASGNLGQVIKKNFPVAGLNKLELKPEERVDIVGPLCTPLDTLAREVELPSVEVGDLIGIFQSGAYARSASPLNFLSYPTPPEVLVTGENASLIRRRGTYEDIGDDIV